MAPGPLTVSLLVVWFRVLAILAPPERRSWLADRNKEKLTTKVRMNEAIRLRAEPGDVRRNIAAAFVCASGCAGFYGLLNSARR